MWPKSCWFESVDVQATTEHLSLTLTAAVRSASSSVLLVSLSWGRVCSLHSPSLHQNHSQAPVCGAAAAELPPPTPPPPYGVSWYSCFIVESRMGGVLGGQSQAPLFIAALLLLQARGLCTVSVSCRGLWRGQEVNREGHLDPGCVYLLETSDSWFICARCISTELSSGVTCFNVFKRDLCIDMTSERFLQTRRRKNF